MQRTIFAQKFSSMADLLILMVMGTAIYGVVSMGREWQGQFHPVTLISLSFWALPKYALLSAMRGIAAYLISLFFTLTVGYIAAKSKPAEKMIIPLLDILQSIPVLGFLPGLVLGLISLFPNTNTGLELAAVIMIFSGQVWNMTFSFYSSVKSLPTDFQEASTVIGLNWFQKLLRVELPFSAVNLAWNSLMSMAGGWFFLSVCESFPLGNRQFRLPGIGSYMAVAIQEGNRTAMLLAVITMVFLIVTMDFFIWRPILSWVQRFRLEDVPGVAPVEPLIQVVIRESRILRWIKLTLAHMELARRERWMLESKKNEQDPVIILERTARKHWSEIRNEVRRGFQKIGESKKTIRVLRVLMKVGVLGVIYFCVYELLKILMTVSPQEWGVLFKNTFWTLIRVFFALVLSTLWAVPAGIWIGMSPRRVRMFQPIIQVLASFPAPMLYPVVLAILFQLNVSFDWASMFLMLMGVQWYVLFNVLAGALRIPAELGYALSLMETSRWDRWKTLYLPSVFPSLVTGWVSAAGGAWNASIVAEYLQYHGEVLKAGGLGATISVAAANQDFRTLAASLTIMVLVVVLLNRSVWARIYRMVQTRYRLDL